MNPAGELLRFPFLLVGIALFWVFQAFLLGRIADRTLTRPVVSWVLLFFFLPIVSHFLYGFLYAAVRWRWRRARVEQRILGPSAAAYPHLMHKAFDYSPAAEVTPFAQAEVAEQTALQEDYILYHFRDKKVEELIERKQWEIALKLVEGKIREAQSVGDKKSEQVYQAYLELIKPRIGRLFD